MGASGPSHSLVSRSDVIISYILLKNIYIYKIPSHSRKATVNVKATPEVSLFFVQCIFTSTILTCNVFMG